MKSPKKESVIGKKALANTQLGDEAYKRMIKDARTTSLPSKFDFPLLASEIKGKLTPAILKKAFHSQYTNPICRAVLIHSLFEREDGPKYFNRFKLAGNQVSALHVVVGQKKGSLYLRFTDEDFRYPGSSKGLMTNIKLKLPKAPDSGLYLKAVTTGSKQAQKMALGLSEFQTCLFSIVQDIVGTIKNTDPLNRFGSDPYEDTETPLEESPETGSLDDRDEINDRFKRHEEILRHTRDQLNLLLPQANELGIDTAPIMDKFDELLSSTMNYNQLEFHREDMLYEHHEIGQELVEMLGNTARFVENIDLDSPMVKNLNLSTKVHTYVPFPTQKIQYVKTRVRDGAASAIEDYSTRVLKYTDGKFTGK